MIDKAYLSGVLHSDGWCSELSLGLRTKDRDFAKAFSAALNRVCGIHIQPRLENRRYWIVRTSNKTGKFAHLKGYRPAGDTEIGVWLRGLFDGDGNASLIPQRHISPNAYSRRIAFYSTNRQLLIRAMGYLTQLGITTRLRATTNSESHIGTKTVYELRLRSGKENYRKYRDMIGSTIERKRQIIEAIPESYRPDISTHCRAAQLKGAKTKHKRTMEITLPQVARGVRQLIERGVKPTQRNCRQIPGYNSIQRYIRQADLIEMAMQEDQ